MLATLLTLMLAGFTAAQPPGAQSTVTASVAPVEADLKAKLEREPRHIPHYLALARLYSDVRRPAEAESVLRRALTVQPDSRDVHSELSLLFHQTGEYQKAIELGSSWGRLVPSSPEGPTVRATGYLRGAEHGPKGTDDRLAMIGAGLADADAALALQPDHLPALYVKAQLVALQATLVPAGERAAVEAERDALIERMKVASPHMNRQGPAPARAGSMLVTPRKIHHVDPVYPAAARKARAEGIVTLEARIDEKGTVTEVRVLQSIPLLDQAAVRCVKQWRFAPTMINGSAVPIIAALTVEFKLPR